MSYNLDTHLPTFQIFLASRQANAISEDHGHANFYLESPVVPPLPHVDALVSLTDAQIPYAWYTFDTVSDDFNLLLQLGAGGSPTLYNVTITHGNYNAFDLQDELNSRIKVTLGLSSTSTDWATYNINTNRFSLTIPATYVAHDRIGVSSTSNNKTLFGINVNGEPVTLTTVTFTNIVDLTGIRAIHFTTNLPTLNRDSFQNLGTGGTLAKIPVNSTALGLITFIPSQPLEVYLTNFLLTEIEVWLRDDAGNIIDFNGTEWEATLTIKWVNSQKRQTLIALDDHMTRKRQRQTLRQEAQVKFSKT